MYVCVRETDRQTETEKQRREKEREEEEEEDRRMYPLAKLSVYG